MKFLLNLALPATSSSTLGALDVNTLNSQGRSALYFACHNGHVDCVECLLSAGAIRDGITHAELLEMPMKYFAFSAQNSPTTLSSSSETPLQQASDDLVECVEGGKDDEEEEGIRKTRAAIMKLMMSVLV